MHWVLAQCVRPRLPNPPVQRLGQDAAFMPLDPQPRHLPHACGSRIGARITNRRRVTRATRRPASRCTPACCDRLCPSALRPPGRGGEGLPLRRSRLAVSGDPFERGHPATPRERIGLESGAGLMARSVPRFCDALLRARPCLFRAPRARRLRPARGQNRPVRRQGPAGASDPGHDVMPACGRGAPCLLVQLAGRSPAMRHRGVDADGART